MPTVWLASLSECVQAIASNETPNSSRSSKKGESSLFTSHGKLVSIEWIHAWIRTPSCYIFVYCCQCHFIRYHCSSYRHLFIHRRVFDWMMCCKEARHIVLVGKRHPATSISSLVRPFDRSLRDAESVVHATEYRSYESPLQDTVTSTMPASLLELVQNHYWANDFDFSRSRWLDP